MEVPQEIKVVDLVNKVGGRYERVNRDTGKISMLKSKNLSIFCSH